MSQEKFDDTLREALNNMQVSYDPDSWELLHSRISADPELNEENQAAEEFDSAIKDKLNKVSPEYIPTHWRLMKERIRREFSLQEKLIRYKVAEIALMLLIVITILQYGPYYSPKGDNRDHHAEAFAQNAAEADNLSTRSTQGNLLKKDGNPLPGSSDKTVDAESGVALRENKGENILTTSGQSVKTLESRTIQTVKQQDLETGNLQNNHQGDDLSLPVNVLALNPTGIKTSYDFFLPDISLLKSPANLRVSMFSSVDYNYIKTPYDDIFHLPEYGRYAPGYGGGVTFGVKFGKWEVETGGIYASKEYQPRIPNEIVGSISEGYAEVGFKNIQLNMVELPLNLRYEFGKIQRWRFYGQTGASLHLAVQANYDFFPTNLNQLFSRQALEENQPRLESKKFADGLLEGGNFEENSYFTANIGVGVEHLLSTRFSLFFQPNLQAYLLPGYNNGLGPNQDRLSSFSILTGARVTLW